MVTSPRSPQIRAVGTGFLRQRPLVTLPVMVANIALFAAGDAPPRQLIALGFGFGLLQAMFVIERVAGVRALSETTLARSLVVTAAGLAVGCAATGGLASPLVPLLLAPTGVAFAGFGRSRVSTILLALLLASTFGLALLPRGVPFAPLGSPHRELATALAVGACAILLRLGVAALADAHAAAAAALGRAGDDAAWSATARARELDDLGARVAHEVNNPLAAIRGLVEVMVEARQGTDDRDARRLAVVAGEVERIEGILRDYLDHRRPLAELEPTDVDLAELGRDIAAVLEARAERSGIHLAAEGPPTLAWVDPRRLKEALLNLALNALEATPAGARVDLGWRSDGAAGDVVVELRDRGRGMSPDVLARIGTAGFTTRAGGTGLGVALARAVVEQHGGTLLFTSETGHGTLATIRLPARPG